jgi:Ca2+-binding RTX toxin-like protein
MAIVKAGAGALRMDDLQFGEGGTVSYSPTNVRITFAPGWYTDFGGSYAFGPGGFSGTVSSIVEIRAGRERFTVTDANADAQTLFGLIDSGNVAAATAYVMRDGDQISGRNKDDVLLGYGGDDLLRGYGGQDTLDGGLQNDRLSGGDGDDTLIGGLGMDRLEGGDASDTFVFATLGDSTVAATGRDTIVDFSARQGDTIDLSAIDAIAGGSDDAFTLVNRFHGVAGELVVRAVRGGGFLVQGDVDGVGGADFAILVEGTVAPAAGDFML